MLIDDVTISVAAGSGGKGAVAFNKNLMSLGPAGGTGGTGGSVYFEGVADLSALNHFRFKKKVVAESGDDGRGQFVDGQSAETLVLPVPVGTVIHNLATGKDEEVVAIGERVLVAKGGRGGKGNFHFRSSTNTSPRQFQEGQLGETAELRLELKLIADVGFVGLPNVGKSSLLNELTRASAKVANYPFTTLEPNLGVHYDLILADIPGLIEGASGGRGLGIKFLRHIERTRILFHFVAADSADPVADYKVVRAELKAYNPALAKKEEYLIVSRSDEASPEKLKKIVAAMKKLNPKILAISIYDDVSLAKAREILATIADGKRSAGATRK
ncbi:MAG: GTPase ObgE [Patescibacteria group bacterium]